MYRLLVLGTAATLAVVADTAEVPNDAIICVDFKPYNVYDNTLSLGVKLSQIGMSASSSDYKLSLKFSDISTDDTVYEFEGTLQDADNIASLVAVMDASEEFEFVELHAPSNQISKYADLAFFNPISSLGRKSLNLAVPAGVAPERVDVFGTITGLDDTPQTLYMRFTDDVGLYTEMVRTAVKLDARLWIELDPSLTVDQAIMVASELNPQEHRVRFLWSPIVARPANSVGLRGRKVPRVSGGYVVAQHMLRDANVNEQGIPPLHTPIAGFDFPITFVGIEQRAGVLLDDPTRKRLADAKINVVQRIKYDDGVRFIIGDGLTAYSSNNSLLKLTNASDISMFIDNRVKQIVFRHLLKATDNTIEDATKDIRRFLDACTSKERKLLKQSEELGGYYQISLTPRNDRPYDAINVKVGYRTQGMTRAAYLDTVISK